MLDSNCLYLKEGLEEYEVFLAKLASNEFIQKIPRIKNPPPLTRRGCLNLKAGDDLLSHGKCHTTI
ncbi:hypothetical protein, partial [Acinetobacter sp. NIPH 2024]